MKSRVQQRREVRNLRAKVKRSVITRLSRVKPQPIRIRVGSVLALVIRRMKRGTMATCWPYIVSKKLLTR